MNKKSLILILFALILSTLTGCKELVEIYNSFKTGARCQTAVTCLDGACLTEDQGFPGGMCSGEPCDQNGCLSLFSECFQADIPKKGQTTVCLPTCANGRTCDRASEGYECRVLNDDFVCVPPSSVHTSVPGVTGEACTVDSECQGNNAVCMTSMDNGYCSQSCTVGGSDCLNQQPCVHSDESDPSSSGVCLKGCSSNDDCRFGYACQSYDGANVCLSSKTSKPRNPQGTDDGTPCNAGINCKGGTCIRSNGGESSSPGQKVPYPGGYCTTRDCSSDNDCNGAKSKCVSRGRTTACFKSCSTDGDCRSGYSCVDTPQGKVCDSKTSIPDVKPTNLPQSLQIKCTTGDIKFDIPAGAVGFYIAPFSENGRRVTPVSLQKDSATPLDILNSYRFGAVNSDILGSMAPMLFPASDFSKFKSAFGAGHYTMKVKSSAPRVCYYILPKMSEGHSLNVKIYLVGLSGIRASNAASNKDIQALVARMQKIYKQMGINVSVAGYVDVSPSVANRYKIIRNFNDVFSLVATSKDESTLDANLVVNVFLIQDFAISEASGLLGVSTGIPGMAGMGGTIGSGLVFTTAALGNDNQQLGQTMAHEIGHFLGLRHTTEHGGSAHDPISDTAECRSPELQYACPDARNFMFAFAMGPDQTNASSGQGFVVRRSPLVK